MICNPPGHAHADVSDRGWLDATTMRCHGDTTRSLDQIAPLLSTISVISEGASRRMGGPQKPVPRLT